MNAQYFIDKLTPIPDDQWITGQFCDAEGRCCVLGHCGERRGIYEDTPEVTALKKLFAGAFVHLRPDDVNDIGQPGFRQATPKARILAALEYIKTLE